MSLDACRKAVKDFYDWFIVQPEETQKSYGGPATMDDYTFCFFCGNTYKNFRPAKAGDCPNGCTIQPIALDDQEQE